MRNADGDSDSKEGKSEGGRVLGLQELSEVPRDRRDLMQVQNHGGRRGLVINALPEFLVLRTQLETRWDTLRIPSLRKIIPCRSSLAGRSNQASLPSSIPIPLYSRKRP